MNTRLAKTGIGWVFFLVVELALADIQVIDDHAREIVLEKPAQRIISLAPHVTENIFSAGAGEKLVGVVKYSDYPPATKDIPLVGSHAQINLEVIVDLQPDLVVVWKFAKNKEVIEKIKRLGIPVYHSEPRSFQDIVKNIRDIAVLADSMHKLDPSVNRIEQTLQQVQRQYKNKTRLNVFYQVWSDPLITLNGAHFITRVLQVCGAHNVFADLEIIAPHVSVEAVLDSNPDVIVTGGSAMVDEEIARWHKWQTIKAVKNGHFVQVDSDAMHRHTLRMLNAIAGFCRELDKTRGA